MYYQLAVLLTEPLSYFIIYDHIEILHKNTIRKMRLYKFIGVFYSHPLFCLDKKNDWIFITSFIGQCTLNGLTKNGALTNAIAVPTFGQFIHKLPITHVNVIYPVIGEIWCFSLYIFLSTVIPLLYADTCYLLSIGMESEIVDVTNFWRESWTVLDISVGKVGKSQQGIQLNLMQSNHWIINETVYKPEFHPNCPQDKGERLFWFLTKMKPLY